MSIQEVASENTSCDRFFELAFASTDLARLVSKNPSAPPELLRELSASSDLGTEDKARARLISCTGRDRIGEAQLQIIKENHAGTRHHRYWDFGRRTQSTDCHR